MYRHVYSRAYVSCKYSKHESLNIYIYVEQVMNLAICSKIAYTTLLWGDQLTKFYGWLMKIICEWKHDTVALSLEEVNHIICQSLISHAICMETTLYGNLGNQKAR